MLTQIFEKSMVADDQGGDASARGAFLIAKMAVLKNL
jgi:hypothetical protein